MGSRSKLSRTSKKPPWLSPKRPCVEVDMKLLLHHYYLNHKLQIFPTHEDGFHSKRTYQQQLDMNALFPHRYKRQNISAAHLCFSPWFPAEMKCVWSHCLPFPSNFCSQRPTSFTFYRRLDDSFEKKKFLHNGNWSPAEQRYCEWSHLLKKV